MVLPVSTSSPVQMISSRIPGLSGAGQGRPVEAKVTPQRMERVAPERQSREHVADHRGKGEAMAGEAGGDEHAFDAGDGAYHGKLVRRESLEPDPAPGELAAGQRRVDLAGNFQASLHALIEH